MAEKANELPKDHPRRDAIARQLKIVRRRDRGAGAWYEKDRSGHAYVELLRGVRCLFDYVGTLKVDSTSDPIVLDIGAGTTAGIDDLARGPFGRGLEFKATVLTRTPDIEQHLGNKNVHRTSAESLRGIPDGSVACALSVFSIAYSADPKLVITSIDRVLMGGGVLKAVFDDTEAKLAPKGVKTSKEFQTALRTLGYDVAADEGESTVVAIKPPLPKNGPRAKGLLEEDIESQGVQATLIGGRMRYE